MGVGRSLLFLLVILPPDMTIQTHQRTTTHRRGWDRICGYRSVAEDFPSKESVSSISSATKQTPQSHSAEKLREKNTIYSPLYQPASIDLYGSHIVPVADHLLLEQVYLMSL